MRRPEQEIHVAVVAHLRQRGSPGLVFWHTPNNVHGSRRRDYVAGAIHKAMGARAGVSDLILLHHGTLYALELKAKGGKPTKEQLEFLAAVRAASGVATWVVGLDVALKWLEIHGLLIGRTT